LTPTIACKQAPAFAAVSTDSHSFTDPYAEVPTFWRRHADWIAAAAVLVATVALAVLTFPPFHAPELAYAMLVPGIFWAYLRPRLKLYAWTMFAAQAVAWTILLGWLHNVTWVGLFLLGPLVGAWVGSWYLLAWWAMPRIVGRPTPVRLLAMLGLAGAWVLIEWTRSWLLGGFPWLPLAASQWERVSILQVAAFTGAGGVSFVLVAMNLGFAAYAHRLFREGESGLRKRSQEFFLAMFLLLACLCVHVTESFNRGRFAVPFLRVAMVQPDIPQEVKWDPARGPAILDVLEKTTLEAAVMGPNVLLWPEATTPWAVRGDANARAFVESLASRTRTPLLLGSVAIENRGGPDEQWFNGVFLVEPDTGLQAAYYAKRRLVPFGEFVPLRPLLGWLSKFVPIGDDFSRGVGASPLSLRVKGETVTLAPLICYEDIYADLARASARAGCDALVVLTNNGWFGRGGAAYQHAAHSVLRAVETRRLVLRCGNAGWSGWIDEFGNVRSTLTDSTGSVYFRGAKTIEVRRDARWIGRDSFYVRHGDWFIAVCAALALLGGLLLSAGASSAPAPVAAEE
jgi:apolipoprotein N-acyltransferase